MSDTKKTFWMMITCESEVATHDYRSGNYFLIEGEDRIMEKPENGSTR